VDIGLLPPHSEAVVCRCGTTVRHTISSFVSGWWFWSWWTGALGGALLAFVAQALGLFPFSKPGDKPLWDWFSNSALAGLAGSVCWSFPGAMLGLVVGCFVLRKLDPAQEDVGNLSSQTSESLNAADSGVSSAPLPDTVICSAPLKASSTTPFSEAPDTRISSTPIPTRAESASKLSGEALSIAKPPNRRWLVSALLAGLVVTGVSAWCAGSAAWLAVAIAPPFILVLGVMLLLRIAGLDHISRRGWLVYGWCWLAWSCWLGAGLLFWVTTVHVDCSTATVGWNAASEPLSLRVQYDDAPVVRLDRPRACTFTVRFFQRDRVAVQVFGPDGWVNCVLSGSGNYFRIDSLALSALYLDNRGQAEAEVVCGEVRLSIAAGAREVRWLAAPAGARPLTVNGEQVGVLRQGHYLVDLGGGHSYRLRDHIYTDGKIAIGPEFAMAVPLVFGRGGPDVLFQGQRCSQLPRRVDCFLTPVPQSITGLVMETLAELRDEP
jgi:hypothetical protein